MTTEDTSFGAGHDGVDKGRSSAGPAAGWSADGSAPNNTPERRKTNLLRAYWKGLRGDREFPAFADVDPGDIRGLWPYCLVMKVADNGSSLEFEYVGSALKEGYGLMQKAAISGMSQGKTVVGKMVALAHDALARGARAHDEGSFCNEWGDRIKHHCLVVPLSDDQETINYLLGLAGYLEIKRACAPGLEIKA